MKMLKLKKKDIPCPQSVAIIRYSVIAKILFKKNYYDKEKIHLPKFKQGSYISQV